MNETLTDPLPTLLVREAMTRHQQPHPRFAAVLSEPFIRLLGESAPLHHIGKAGISDQILQKPGKLMAAE